LHAITLVGSINTNTSQKSQSANTDAGGNRWQGMRTVFFHHALAMIIMPVMVVTMLVIKAAAHTGNSKS